MEMFRQLLMSGKTGLPKGYYECEYIDSQGKYFIDTGFKPNQDTKVVMDVDLLSSTAGQYPTLFGSYTNGSNQFAAFLSSGKWTAWFGTTTLTSNVSGIGRYSVALFNGRFVVGDYVGAVSSNNFSSQYSLCLFAMNQSDGVHYIPSARLYSCQIYDNGTKVRDFIPCVNPDGYFGLYDTIGKQFYRMKEQIEIATAITTAGATISLGNWTKSTSVSNPDSSAYDGVYESNAISSSSSTSCTLTNIKCSTIYVRSYGESCCDYITVYNSSGTSIASTSGKAASGTDIGSYLAVNVSGQSSITVTYSKDGSVTSGTDKGYLLVPKVTETSTTTEIVDSIGSGKVIIPENYTWQNAIYGGTGAYINTGYNPNSDTKVALTGYLYKPTSYTSQVFGSSDSSQGFKLYLGSEGYYYYGHLGSTYCSIQAATEGPIEAEMGLAQFKINGLTSSYSNPSYAVSYPMLLFNSSYNGTLQTPTPMNLYHCAIKDAKTGYLVRLFVPCKNSSNVYGLYDVVNNTFYNSASATAFTAEFVEVQWDFPYTGSVQTASLHKGTYKLEVWGAQGGSYSSYYGGVGGYSYGTLTLSTTTQLYIYTGGQPATVTATGAVTGGFNGGGNGCCRYYSGTYTYGQGGGGASDIRIGTDSLYARVIVAGGGGGSASVNALTTKYGGGTTGASASGSYYGTQTTAGSNGSFGQGGSATTDGTNYKYGSGGGGGGWYGGGAYTSYSDSSSSYRDYNGGGSGFVWTGSNAPSGYLLNSSHYLTSAATIAGNNSFTSPTGTSETGHTGNGYVRITKIT